MKRFFTLLLAAPLLLAACKSTPKNSVTINSEDGKTTATIDVNQLKANGDEWQKKANELKALPPVTLDQLKAMIPETLAGGKRTSYSANSAMGTSMAEANYAVNDSMRVRLAIFDCAGEAGSGLFAMQFMGAMNMASETETDYTKTIDFNGGKAIEKAEKDGSHCSLTYFSGDRFMVTLEGDRMQIEAIKTIASHMSLKQ